MKRKYYLIICRFFVAIVIFTKDHLESYYSKSLNQFVNNGNQVEYNIYRSRLSDHFIDDKTKFDKFLKTKWNKGTTYSSNVIFVDDDNDYKIVDLFGGWPVDIRE